ncbi:hypothetical protein OIO90_002985 [Microbotryomycetes sp. JL221]|nr:hypothetical protein OIO90_002985 [Microbotryomycetes sp. JL221]
MYRPTSQMPTISPMAAIPQQPPGGLQPPPPPSLIPPVPTPQSRPSSSGNNAMIGNVQHPPRPQQQSQQQQQQTQASNQQRDPQTGPVRTAPQQQRKSGNAAGSTTKRASTSRDAGKGKGKAGDKESKKTRSRYNLECKFTTKTGVISAPTQPTGSTSKPNEATPVVAQKLFEIAARLQSIESALHIQQGISPVSHDHAESSHFSSHVAHSDDEGAGSSGDEMDQDDSGSTKGTKSNTDSINPMSEIHRSMTALGTGTTPRGSATDDYGAPDIVRRGILTPEECQELFDFFFASLHPWVMMLSVDEDRDAMGVRSRSSLLFHTILVLSTSYSTPFPSQLHTTLVTFVNNIFAPQILSPQPHELTTDFLRALDLLNLYKVTQFATRRTEGMDIAEAMRASKVNGMASWMMQGILARTAERLDLSSTVQRFSRAYSASANGKAISPDLIKDLRLYYWLLSNDVHGNVQSGRRCNMEGATALTTTRLFSSLHLQPYDVRLAASVEMFEIARPILRSTSYERTRRIPKADLERYNVGMAAWEDFWVPVLVRELAVDPLALSVMCPFAYFITLVYNASAYVSYKRNQAYPSDTEDKAPSGGHPTSSLRRGGKDDDTKPRDRRDGPRELTAWEYETLAKSVRAAEGLIFTLSEESRVPGAWRNIQWAEAERSDGYRKLTLDDTVVSLSKWGMDAITCVAYIFPLVFLCKLVNDGLLTADLVLLQRPQIQSAWNYPQKLPRLLELGASFLEAVSINLEHPAMSQAQVLRALLDAGIKGYSPSSPHGGPRHAATVMSPLASTTKMIFPPPNPPAFDSSKLAQYATERAQQLQQQQQQQQQQQTQQQHHHRQGSNNLVLDQTPATLLPYQQSNQSSNRGPQTSTPSMTLANMSPHSGRMQQSNLASTLSAALGQGGARSINPTMNVGGLDGNASGPDTGMFGSTGGTSTPTSGILGMSNSGQTAFTGGVSAGGMDSALTSVLNGFDPFFSDSVGGAGGNNFWDWTPANGGGAGSTSSNDVEWPTV